jgi:molybdate transport system substrate-binding protein
MLCVALLLTCLAPARATAEDVRVAAAISLQEALVEAAAAHERQGGEPIKFTFGSSGQLLAQIKTGAPIDVFVSAADKQMDALMESGLGDPASRRVVATNTLVLIVPAGAGNPAVNAFDRLGDAAVKRLAVGEPQTVPAGQYAKQVLEKLGLSGAVAGKIVYGANVRQVLDYVQRGEVSAGIVYATDAAQAGDKVRILATAPPNSHDEIVYPAAVVTAGPNAAGGRQFLAYLTSPAGQRHLTARGFGAASTTAAPGTRPASEPAHERVGK